MNFSIFISQYLLITVARCLLCRVIVQLYLWWNEWVWSLGTLECLEVRGRLTCLKRKTDRVVIM